MEAVGAVEVEVAVAAAMVPVLQFSRFVTGTQSTAATD